jgi:hypothetical protein
LVVYSFFVCFYLFNAFYIFPKTINFPGIYFISTNLCLGLYYLILSFNSLKLVEEGVIYKFRLIKWNDIRAYKNVSGSLDWDRYSVFKIIFLIKPKFRYMSSFLQIHIEPRKVDFITQTLSERLTGKNIGF